MSVLQLTLKQTASYINTDVVMKLILTHKFLDKQTDEPMGEYSYKLHTKNSLVNKFSMPSIILSNAHCTRCIENRGATEMVPIICEKPGRKYGMKFRIPEKYSKNEF